MVFSFFRFAFLLILVGSFINDVYNNNSDRIYPLIGIICIIIIDFFVNQKVIITKDSINLYKRYWLRKINFKDSNHIILKRGHTNRVPGCTICITLILKTGKVIKSSIGPILVAKKSEEKIKDFCKYRCIKFSKYTKDGNNYMEE